MPQLFAKVLIWFGEDCRGGGKGARTGRSETVRCSHRCVFVWRGFVGGAKFLMSVWCSRCLEIFEVLVPVLFNRCFLKAAKRLFLKLLSFVF